MVEYPEQPIDLYQYPLQIPYISWEDFPKDLPFEEYQHRAEAFGMQHTINHGSALYEWARCGEGEGYIVELGTYWGAGASYLAFGSKTARREKVITIDVDRGHMWSIYSTEFYSRPPMQMFRAQMNWIMMGVADWIIPIRCDSITASEFLDIKIRVLHVDADHYFNPAAWDILKWEPKLIPGAIVIIHDYNLEGVAKAVDECIQKNPAFSDVTVVDVLTAYAFKL